MTEAAHTPVALLAGGRGTRLHSVISDRPKPLAPILDRPFLEWQMLFLHKQGFREFWISTGYRADQMAEALENFPLPESSVRLVAEENPLGTAGGFLHAAAHRPQAPETWLVCNGDSLFVTDLEPLFATRHRHAAEAVLAGRRVEDASRYGTLETSQTGRLQAFREKAGGSGLMNAGIFLLNPALLRSFASGTPLSFEKDVFPKLLTTDHALWTCELTGPFLDIGTPASYGEADSFVRHHLVPFLES